MEEVINPKTVEKNVSNAELDSMLAKGLVRVLRYILYAVVLLLDMLLPVAFYAFVLIAAAFSIAHVAGVEQIMDNSAIKECVIQAYIGFCGMVWLAFERTGTTQQLKDYLNPNKN
jgi:hypothetical protein